MPLSDLQIQRLLNQKAITDDWPWATHDQRLIEKNIQSIVAEIRRKLRLEVKAEYGHYGSGYASFVDCWLYRPNDHFRYRAGNNYHGLVILFSRLSPYYVLGEGTKSWDETGCGSYLPEFDFVDNIQHQAVLELVPKVQSILDDHRLERFHQHDLETLLPPGLNVPTVLATRVFRHFDALFYWED